MAVPAVGVLDCGCKWKQMDAADVHDREFEAKQVPAQLSAIQKEFLQSPSCSFLLESECIQQRFLHVLCNVASPMAGLQQLSLADRLSNIVNNVK